MSQQGERSTGHEDEWWGQLYDDSTEDTGPAPAADSLDDRFASAAGTVGRGAEPQAETPERAVPSAPDESPVVPEQRGGGSGRTAAPWPGATPRGEALEQRLARWDRTELAARGEPPDQPPGSVRRGEAPDPGPWEPGDVPGPSPDDPRRGIPERQPAPWEPPPAAPPAPMSFPPPPMPIPPRPAPLTPPTPPTPPGPPPPGPAPSGFRAEPLRGRTSMESPGAAALRDEPRPAATAPADARPGLPALPAPEPVLAVPHRPPSVAYVGSGPPTYAAEPTALPPADPDDLDDLVADTVLDGARYGASTLRAASVRGDSARFRGEPRRDSLLTARFGVGEQALVLVAMATGARATPGAHRAAAEACHWIGRAVGRSHARLAEDIRAARRGDLKSGLQRLTDRSLGKLRASAAEQGIEPEEYSASLRCLLLTGDPECRTRVFFGVGAGGLFRLRDGEWQDIEPRVAEATGEAMVGYGSMPHETPEGDRLTMDLGITTPPSPYELAPEPSPKLSAALEQGGTPIEPAREPFRFRASVARPGDTLLLCTGGLAEPLRGEPQFCEHLTTRWSAGEPPGLAAFLADTQVRVKGYADDRTAAAVWEA